MKKFFRRLIILILLVIIIVGVVLFLNGNKLYQKTISNMPLSDKIAEIKAKDTYVSIKEVPDYYINAIIAVEDHRFREHGSVDIYALVRAIVSNIRSKELNEGGSTITQQVAKNFYFITEDDVISRKIAEFLVARDLEEKYSKDDILEFYMNTIYFGEGYYGIREASNGYFKKEPIDMTLSEATILAGVPNAPSVYAPTVNPDLAKSRQKKVISDMVEYGYLSKSEADKILE